LEIGDRGSSTMSECGVEEREGGRKGVEE